MSCSHDTAIARSATLLTSVLLAASLVVQVACDTQESSSAPGPESLCEGIDNDVVITSAAELASISEETAIAGDLIFCQTSEAEVTQISLPNLQEIYGNLVIYQNPGLTSVDIPALQTIGGQPHSDRQWVGLLLEANALLDSVSLPSLTSVNDYIWLSGNPELADFDLPSLARVAGALTLSQTFITSINGFASLRSVGNGLAFADNEALTEVSGFGSLVTISNDIFVSNNPVLTTVSLPLVRSMGRHLTVIASPVLDLLDLAELTIVGHEVELNGTALVNLDGLAKLEVVGHYLAIDDNDALFAATLPALEMVGSHASFADNAVLDAIDVAALTYVGDDLEINNNAKLAFIDFAGLTTIGGDLTVTSNPGLPTCAADAIETNVANIGGIVTIAGNDDLGECP